MPIFIARVVETITQEVEYSIDADDLDEAQEKASIGDTIQEKVTRTAIGVLDRQVVSLTPETSAEA